MGVQRAAAQRVRSPQGESPPPASAIMRSQLPRMYVTGSASEPSRSSVSRGMGPNAMSPPTRMRSGAKRSTSASTASSARRFPWMS